ncbi:alpha-glucuronidase [Pedobacter sp. HMF7647]|uniref:Alpha-glucuronidase n=1 Tax=Hufsiella arboris TaxID=2695275 RepID=A0A7K1YB81_9SPHI|nr:alpha-glucuronidase [Hufsiella arboris]MXV51836.1 alpha-glucuronidase [Hufsiella arboris]
MKISYLSILFMLLNTFTFAQDGHDLWLYRYNPNPVKILSSHHSVILATAKQELTQGWKGNPNATVKFVLKKDKSLAADGFTINSNVITANTDKGILYGVFDLLRRQNTGETISDIKENPSYQVRILNHWDNPDGSVERGYAGNSIFWRNNDVNVTENDLKLWKEYARANASIGINAAVLNNVNASPLILTPEYLQRVKAIAAQLRPYGIKTYLSVKFSSPALLGKLKTSDPLNPEVIRWWNEKVKKIYTVIPDFGGFLVKASSEGQPGPQDFGRTHADGANMLADAVKPYGGIIMWRAFVYSPHDMDRAKQAYNEFMPLDGKFRSNVIVQVKNGPIDFQPREPFSPLFGAMKKNAVMPEFQITQEYLGHSVYLVYLSTMWEECLKADTYQAGKGSTVAKVTDGSVFKQALTAIAGVSNIGLDTNWTGHQFGQANWYAFGRLAWNNNLSSEQIADEWLKLTFYNSLSIAGKEKKQEWESKFLAPVKQMMMDSREAAVNYMTPLGLHHIMAANEHYGPGPWWGPKGVRADWTPLYYHKAGEDGVGFDRTHKGSDAVSQYHEPLAGQYNDPKTCPEELLLWFHHIPWNYQMKSGKTLWNELCLHYDKGVSQVRNFQKVWDEVEPYVDQTRFTEVQRKLRKQATNAILWKDACLLYFQKFSHMPIPYDLERPVNNLDEIIANDKYSK